jgi:hypothetical protein
MKSMKMEIVFLIIVLFIGVAANTAPLSYDKKNSKAFPASYPVIYPKSVGANDGWVLESSEFSEVGGMVNATAVTINVGDDAARRQYRGILHFKVVIPPTAVIVNAVLRLKRQGAFVGSNPFASLGQLRVDMSKPSFGTPALLASDFQAVAGRSSVAIFSPTPVGGWYKAVLNAVGRAYINKNGTTQFRLRFVMGDNHNSIADYVRFISGNYSTISLRPTLEVQYYVP